MNTAKCYITRRMNELMYRNAFVQYHPSGGHCEIKFIRKPEWNCDKFSKLLRQECGDLESRLFEHEGRNVFYVDITRQRNDGDDDCVEFCVEIGWGVDGGWGVGATNPLCPFGKMFKYGMERTQTDGTMLLEASGHKSYYDDTEDCWVGGKTTLQKIMTHD